MPTIAHCSALIHLIISYFSIELVCSQSVFSLNIASMVNCTKCKFNWPTTSQYGYSFNIDNISETVLFAAITINYDSYNSSDITCDINSGFIEAYNYQISIYYRESNAFIWTSKGSKSGNINREQTIIDRISLIDINPSILLISGQWYIGLKLSWNLLFQHCNFIMDGWNISSVPSYPLDLISTIPNPSNDEITFKQMTCLQGDVSTNSAITLSTQILPHFDIEFEAIVSNPTKTPNINSVNTYIGDGISWWQSTSYFIPIHNTTYGSLQLRDAMYMEFDIIFHGPIPSNWQNIFRIGFASYSANCDGYNSRYPSLWMVPNTNKWHFSISDTSNCGKQWLQTTALIDLKYHIIIHYNQSHLFISLNNITYIDTFREATFANLIGQTIYIYISSDEINTTPSVPAANVTISNIIIVSYWYNEGFTFPPTAIPTNNPIAPTITSPTLHPTNSPISPHISINGTYTAYNYKTTWSIADTYCYQMHGTHLATITSDVQAMEAQLLCIDTDIHGKGCWMRLHKVYDNNTWQWMDGYHDNNNNYYRWKLNANLNNDCVYLDNSVNTIYSWNTYDCDNNTNAPIILCNTWPQSIAPTIYPTAYPSQIPSYLPTSIPITNYPTFTDPITSIPPSINPTYHPFTQLPTTNNPTITAPTTYLPTSVLSTTAKPSIQLTTNTTSIQITSSSTTHSPTHPPTQKTTDILTAAPTKIDTTTTITDLTASPTEAPTGYRRLHFICYYNDDRKYVTTYLSLSDYAKLMIQVILNSMRSVTTENVGFILDFVICNVFDTVLENINVECPSYYDLNDGDYDEYEYISVGIFDIASNNELNQYQKLLIDVITSYDFKVKFTENMNDKLENNTKNGRRLLEYNSFKVIRIEIIDPLNYTNHTTTENVETFENDNNSEIITIIIIIIVCLLSVIIIFTSILYVKKLKNKHNKIKQDTEGKEANYDKPNIEMNKQQNKNKEGIEYGITQNGEYGAIFNDDDIEIVNAVNKTHCNDEENEEYDDYDDRDIIQSINKTAIGDIDNDHINVEEGEINQIIDGINNTYQDNIILDDNIIEAINETNIDI